MSVQVFVAANAREGLARVRKELGDDAVVLSTRPHPRGVELLASAYGDLTVPAVSEPVDTAGSSRILAELSRLRGLLQNQLAGFAWGAARRRDPPRVAVMQTLFAAGFGSSLARTLAARLPRGLDTEAAQRWLRQVLIRNLPVQGREADLTTTGGRYALVGSTGAGKTTTLAKRVWEWTQRTGVSEFSQYEAKRATHASPETIASALAILIDRALIRPLPLPPPTGGRPASPRFQVRP